MASILQGSLAEDVADALDAADVPYGLVLHIPGGEQPGPNPWDDPIITEPVDHPCRGWLDNYDADMIDGTLIRSTDTRIMVIASSVAEYVPYVGQSITADGTTFIIVNLKRDPAGACYDIQARA